MEESGVLNSGDEGVEFGNGGSGTKNGWRKGRSSGLAQRKLWEGQTEGCPGIFL